MTNVYRIKGTDNLLMQTIKDQAASLEHGWREAVQNGIDSPGSTRVELDFTHARTVVSDNGDGVDLTTEEGLALLKNLGETNKDRSDDSTIGQFGIGKGQVIAKGHTVMMSGRTALHFDVDEWGLQIKEVPLARPVDGFTVVVSHYPDQVPAEGDFRWSTFESRIEKRFRFAERTLGTEVVVNGETVSDNDPAEEVTGSRSHAETFESDHGDIDIAVRVKKYGGVDVYSNGVYVTTESDLGVSGVVVSHANMDIDFARDAIKDGCPVWGAARDRLAEIRGDLFEQANPRYLNDDARRFMMKMMADDPASMARFKDKKVLRTSSEDYISLEQVTGKTQIGYAPAGDASADRLSESFNMTVLDENDSAVEEFVAAVNEGKAREPDTFDPEKKAADLGLMTLGEMVPDADLNTVQEKKLLAAREMADRLGIDREIRYGESDVAAAWTDGSAYVVITDSAAPSRNRAAWVWELAEKLVHEACHTQDTMEGCSHGRSFDRDYREEWQDAVGVVADFVTEVEREGLADTVEGVQVVRPDMQKHIAWRAEQDE